MHTHKHNVPEFTLPYALLEGTRLCDATGNTYTLRLKASDGTTSSILVTFVTFSGFGEGYLCNIAFPLVLELSPASASGNDATINLPFDQVVAVNATDGRDIIFKTTMGSMRFRADSNEAAFECKLNISSCMGTLKAWRISVVGEAWEHSLDNYCKLNSALTSGDIPDVQRCLDIGCPPDMILNETEETPLCIACRQEDERMIEILLSAGANLTPLNQEGSSVFFESVAMGRTATVRAIVTWTCAHGDLDALLTECDQHGSSIFHAAAKNNGDVDLMKLLCTSSADCAMEELMLQLDQTGCTVLHVAAGEGKLPLLEYLLTLELLVVHINHTDTNGDTCLDLADGLADESNRGKVVRLLESIGAMRGVDLDRSSNAVDSSFSTEVNRAAGAVDLCSTSTQTSPERIQSTAKISEGATAGRVLADINNHGAGSASEPDSRALSKPSSSPPPSSSAPSLTTKKRAAPPPGLANLEAALVLKKKEIQSKQSSSSPATLSDPDLAPYGDMFNTRGQNKGAMIVAASRMKADGISEARIVEFKSACNEMFAKQEGNPKSGSRSEASSDQKGALASMLSGIEDGDPKGSLKPVSSTPSSSARDGNNALAAMLSTRAPMAPLSTGFPTSSMAAVKTGAGPVSKDRRRASIALQRTHVSEGSGDADKSVYCIHVSSTETDDAGSTSSHLLEDSSVQLLEIHFRRKTTTHLKKAPTNTSDQKQGSSHLPASFTDKILDPKRSYMMQIALARFKRLGSHKDVIRIVMTLDLGTKVEPSDLAILCQTFVKKGGITVKTLLPSEDERQRALAYDGDVEALSPAEMWVVEVVKADPKFEDCAKVALTILTLSDDAKELETSLGKLISACVKIRSSDGLRKLLRGALEVSSILNEAYSQPKKSIAMDSIIPLLKKKGSDSKTSLLDILTIQDVAANETGGGAMIDFYDEHLRGSVEDASKISVVEIEMQVSELNSKVDKARELLYYMRKREDQDAKQFVKRCTDFVDDAEKILESLSLLMAKGREEAASLIEFFAEDASRDTSDVFQFVIELAALTKASKEKWLRKNRHKTTKPFSVKVAAKTRPML